MRVSVVGGSEASEDGRATAERVGQEVAERGHDLVCGGLGGMMDAACRGAKRAGGRTIGVLPGEDRAAASASVDVPVATGLGHARNALVVLNGDAVVAIEGGAGTLSELGFAGVYGRPVAGIDTHDAPGVTAVDSATAALDHVETAVEDGE